MPFAPATSPPWQHFTVFAFLYHWLLCTRELKGGCSSPDAILHILHGWEYSSCYYGPGCHWPLLQVHTAGWVAAHPQTPFCKAISTYSVPQLITWTLIPSQLKDAVLPFVRICEVPASPFLQPADVPPVYSPHLPSLSSSANLPWVHFISPLRSLAMISHSISPRIPATSWICYWITTLEPKGPANFTPNLPLV